MNDSIPAIGQLIEPTPVRFSFDAPGWYVAGGVLAVLLLTACIIAWRRYRRNRYRRAALRWLQSEEQRLTPAKEYARLVYAADMLVKRIAMQRYGREVSSLRGKDWSEYINKTWRSEFTADDMKLLDDLYLSETSVDADRAGAFVDKAKQWIKTHRYER